MTKKADLANISTVAIVVEDPGAVNFLAPLVDRFINDSVPVVIYADGIAAVQFSAHGYPVALSITFVDLLEGLHRSMFSMLIAGTSENPNSSAFALFRAAQAARITTIGVVDAAVNAEFRFRGTTLNPLAHAPDWLMVPDEATFVAFDLLGFDKTKICIVGNPARERARTRGREIRSSYLRGFQNKPITLSEKRIVFVSEISDGLNSAQYMKSASYTLTGRGASDQRTVIVVEELLEACSSLRQRFGLNLFLVLRLHPKQLPTDLGLLCSEFDDVSFGGDPLEVVASADVVVGMSSMLMIQAFDMGIPCLAILPRLEETFWLQEISLGLIPVATERKMVQEHLHRLLSFQCYHEPCDLSLEGELGESVAAMIRFLSSVIREVKR